MASPGHLPRPKERATRLDSRRQHMMLGIARAQYVYVLFCVFLVCESPSYAYPPPALGLAAVCNESSGGGGRECPASIESWAAPVILQRPSGFLVKPFVFPSSLPDPVRHSFAALVHR